MILTDVEAALLPSLNSAIQRVLDQLYPGIPLPARPITEKHLSKSKRNTEICARYAAGETLEGIARVQKLGRPCEPSAEFGFTQRRQ